MMKTQTIKVRTVSGVAVVFTALLFLSQVLSTAQAPANSKTVADNEYQTGAILWTQSSAEYRALAYQTFVLARLRLDTTLRNRSRSRLKKPAVIVDVDETV